MVVLKTTNKALAAAFTLYKRGTFNFSYKRRTKESIFRRMLYNIIETDKA